MYKCLFNIQNDIFCGYVYKAVDCDFYYCRNLNLKLLYHKLTKTKATTKPITAPVAVINGIFFIMPLARFNFLLF